MFLAFHCLFNPKATHTDEPSMSVSEGEVPMYSQRDMRFSDMTVCEMEKDMAEIERFGIWI